MRNDFAYLNWNGTKASAESTQCERIAAMKFKWILNEIWQYNWYHTTCYHDSVRCFRSAIKWNKKMQTNDFGFELNRKSCNEYHNTYRISKKTMCFNRTHVNIKHFRLYCTRYSFPFCFSIKNVWILNLDGCFSQYIESS